MKDSCVIVFAKHPRANRVKTRLAKEIGPDKALMLYSRFTELTLDKFRKMPADIFVGIKPGNRKTEFKRWLGSDLFYLVQRGKNLGERMENAFEYVFTLGYEKCILTGTDLPDLPVEFMKNALTEIRKHEAVLGPASDGGYYLIGLRKTGLHRKIFRGVEWSAGSVLEKTIKTLKDNKTDFTTMNKWSDIDTLEDLMNYYVRISVNLT